MAEDDNKVMSEPEVVAALRVGTSNLRRLIRQGRFPPGFYFPGIRGRHWLGRDVNSFLWLQSRVREKPTSTAAKKKAKKTPKPTPENGP